ncbi:integrase family protein [Guyparkeria sp. 1SP6A2]|nr:integrase family protein [Guyparkeria sp. 1SP6A2]
MAANKFKFLAGRSGGVRGVDARATKTNSESGRPMILVEVVRGRKVIASGETQAFIWDSDVSGFGVRYTATRATYIFQGRVRGSGKNRRVSLGRCELLRLDEARDLARNKEREFARGHDEAARRAADDLATFTIGEVLDLYIGKLEGLEAHGKRLKPRTIADVEACKPSLRDWLDRPVRVLTGREVVERHAKLGAKSQARANLVFRYLRAAINHADNELSPEPGEGDPLVDRNPVDRLSRGKKWFKVERRRSRIAQFSEWWAALKCLSGSGKFGDAAADYLRFLALTGCRPSEAFNLRWDCVDLEAGTFTFKNTKNGTDLTLPAGPFLLGLLTERRKVSGSHFVFSNPDGDRPVCHGETDQPFRNQIRKVRAESGVQFMPTDLRREVASILTSLRYGPDVVKIVLNHVSRTTTDVTGGYIHLDELYLRQVMADLESTILRKVRHPRSEPQ